MVRTNQPAFDRESMTLTYGNLKMNHRGRWIDGQKVPFPYETYDSPCVFSKWGSGVITTNMVQLDFSGWGSVIYTKDK